MLSEEKEQNLGESQSILMVSVLPCEKVFSDAFLPGCAPISRPYERGIHLLILVV